MNYKKAEEIMDKIGEKGSIYGLECMYELMNRLGNPQKSLKFVHVAGTNAKGSVIAFLSGALSKAGYLTGRFTSPAVFSRRETISTNSGNITEEEYADLFSEVIEASDKMKEEGFRAPTAFEMECAVAFLYFKLKKCDIVLLEVGLGGDLDATNIIDAPLCAVITPVSKDHVNLLGDSLEEIAMHKAGIIKKGSAVVSAHQQPEVCRVLEKKAGSFGIEVIYPENYKISENLKNLENNSDFSQGFIYNGNNDSYEITLRGKCQIDNATVAIEVLHVLRERGFIIDDDDIKKGLKETQWKGRFSLIHTNPDIIMDGAHNEGAAVALSSSLKEYVSEKKFRNIIMVAGMLSDKDYEKVIKTVASQCTKLITIDTNIHNRQLKSEVLKKTAVRYGILTESANSLTNALDMVFEEIGRGDLLLAFGSFSFLAEFEAGVNERIVKTAFGDY